MADETENVTELPNKGGNGGGKGKTTGKSLLDQVIADINKARAESAKAKLKNAYQKKVDADAVAVLATEEVEKIIKDFDDGK